MRHTVYQLKQKGNFMLKRNREARIEEIVRTIGLDTTFNERMRKGLRRMSDSQFEDIYSNNEKMRKTKEAASAAYAAGKNFDWDLYFRNL